MFFRKKIENIRKIINKDKKYDECDENLEKYDMFALILSAFYVFLPIFIVLALILVLVY